MQMHNLFAQEPLFILAETVRRQAFEGFVDLMGLPNATSAIDLGGSHDVMPGAGLDYATLLGRMLPVLHQRPVDEIDFADGGNE